MAEPVKRMPPGQPAGQPKKLPLTRRERFRKLAEPRVSRCLKVIGHVRNMANTAGYEYTPEEAKQIVEALENAVRITKDAFAGQKEAKRDFRLF